MEQFKKFIPCIYLKDGCAVTGFKSREIVSENPVELACFYSECNADEILVFDLSYDDASHEAALDLIKEICSRANLPVIGAGDVKRMEDIKSGEQKVSDIVEAERDRVYAEVYMHRWW